jgi:predicted phage terminase large subunit-like protein
MPAKTDPLDLLELEERDALLRNDFAFFAQLAFRILKGEEPIWAPYLDLICAHLQDVAFGKTNRLIITLPPRFLKSICGSVALPAFFLGHNPSSEVMCVSYAQDIARGFGEDTRKLMLHPSYKRLFETRLVSERAPAHQLKTKQGGIRRATSIDGVATGLGANLLIFDDPQKAGEALSDAIRRATNEALERTFLSRQNDPQKERIIIIMQRLHEDDFAGHALSLGGDWKLINLPAIAEEDEIWTYDTFLGAHEWRRREGESLHPVRFPVSALEQRRAQSGEAIWAGQYQQRPAPAGGGLVKMEWFRRYALADRPRKFDRIIQSWDTAIKIEECHDFSVCTTWGIAGDEIYLIDVYRERLLYPDLKRAVLDQAKIFKAETVLIEDRASGQQLLQELPKLRFYLAHAINPERDKKMRMASQTALIENGLVYVPEDAPWAAEYLHEMAVFPNGKYDDQVDSTSQFLIWYNNATIEGANALEYMRREYESIQGRKPKPEFIALRPPPQARFGQISGFDGKRLYIDDDGLIRTTRENGLSLLRLPGWTEVK